MCSPAYWRKVRYQIKLLNVLFWGILFCVVILLPMALQLLSKKISVSFAEDIWKQLRILLPLLSMPWLIEILSTWVEMKGNELYQFLDDPLKVLAMFAAFYDTSMVALYCISAAYIKYAKRELFAMLGLTLLIQVLVVMLYQILKTAALTYFLGGSMCLIFTYLPNPILNMSNLVKDNTTRLTGWRCYVIAAVLMMILFKRKREYQP